MTTRGWVVASLMLATIAYLPATTSAVCTGGLANESSADFEIFGLNPDGSRTWVGQRFAIDCDAQFLTVRFHILLGQGPVNGINPVTSGQELVCTVMDAQNRDIASVSSLVAGSLPSQWVRFDFRTLDLGLGAGTLGVKLEIPVDGYAYVQTSNDLVPGNMIINDGANTTNSYVRDMSWAVVWDASSGMVANGVSSWGGVKALFR